jgi:DUF1016 N-terminal domain
MDPETDRQPGADSRGHDLSPVRPSAEGAAGSVSGTNAGYDAVLSDVAQLLDAARRAAARSINAVMTATYWEIGRRIVELEQGGERRAGYGAALLRRLSADLKSRFGRGFSVDNLETMRLFYLAYALDERPGKSPATSLPDKSETLSRILNLAEIADRFPLPWSHYALLVRSARSPAARNFYETEARRSGWTARQLERQIATQFHERTAVSRDRAAMLAHGGTDLRPGEAASPEQEIKDPFVLEFLWRPPGLRTMRPAGSNDPGPLPRNRPPGKMSANPPGPGGSRARAGGQSAFQEPEGSASRRSPANKLRRRSWYNGRQ